MIDVEWKQGKVLRVDIDSVATKALGREEGPLYVELELYFSCLIRKRVLVSRQANEEKTYLRLNDALYVTFSPVMTKSCEIDDTLTPELIEFPIQKRDAFLPKWLKIRFEKNEFQGEFGY